jgi:MFS family permease
MAMQGSSPSTPVRVLWIMLLGLISAFALSQAFRSLAAMMATQLQAEFSLDAQQLGVFAGIFHFAFGSMQLFMGIGIDLYGVRRTLLTAFPLAVAGAALSALAPSYGWVLVGQALTGVGCAPAFLVCTVFIARHFPANRFAAVSGTTMAIGGIGLLATGTPLAWVVQEWSWRMGFGVLAVLSVLAWITVFALVREPATESPEAAAPSAAKESPWTALRQFGRLLAMPQTWGIMALASVTYAAFLTLRGLWLGPLLVERYGMTLVQSGNVAVVASLVSLLTAPLFGRADSFFAARRRRWIVGFALVMTLPFVLLAFTHSVALAIASAIGIGFITGFIILQYSDTREAYPPSMTGRAMAVFTMAMFLGIAMMQWVTGLAASWASQHQFDAYAAVMLTSAAMLALGAAAFALLPGPTKKD